MKTSIICIRMRQLVERRSTKSCFGLLKFPNIRKPPKNTYPQWLNQIPMKLPSAKIELGPIYNRFTYKFLFSGLRMWLANL